MEDIKRLLKKVDEKNSNDIFKQIASKLINEYVILVNAKKFFITELEFYYHSDNHPDPYAHKHKLQYEFGKFYVHEKDGNRGGIDFTLGDSAKNICCGVLLRGLKDTENIYTTGPNNVKKIVFYNNLNVGNYTELQKIIDGNTKVVIDTEVIKREKIYHSTRIGLKPTFEDFEFNGKYVYKLHRFIAYKKKAHAYKEKKLVQAYESIIIPIVQKS